MSGKVRPALFLVGAVGFTCLGYAFAFAVKNGFAFSWEGNWDPVVIGLVGTALLALAATASSVLKTLGAGKPENLTRAVLRALAVSVLSFAQFTGVFMVMWGFILFLSFENAGQSGLAPLAMAIIGAVTNRVATVLLSYVRPRRAKKETYVSTTEDDNAP
jgi:hypothetical protein